MRMLTSGQKRFRKQLLADFYGGVQCIYCGKELSMKQMTIDHLVPKSHGGTNAYHNLVLACQACNQKKATKTLFKFIFEDSERFLHFSKTKLWSFLSSNIKVWQKKTLKKFSWSDVNQSALDGWRSAMLKGRRQQVSREIFCIDFD